MRCDAHMRCFVSTETHTVGSHATCRPGLPRGRSPVFHTVLDPVVLDSCLKRGAWQLPSPYICDRYSVGRPVDSDVTAWRLQPHGSGVALHEASTFNLKSTQVCAGLRSVPDSPLFGSPVWRRRPPALRCCNATGSALQRPSCMPGQLAAFKDRLLLRNTPMAMQGTPQRPCQQGLQANWRGHSTATARHWATSQGSTVPAASSHNTRPAWIHDPAASLAFVVGKGT